MLKDKYILGTVSIVTVTIITGAFLSSIKVSATDDNVVDNININVPISCSMEGTGMTSHNANIANGTYQADIGTTTIKTYCNDSSGFAIYAIGYTDDEYGKNVLTNTTLGSIADIVTGTATSGNTSNWAMKLATPSSPTPTYPLTLDNSFGSYHSVPSEYTKVAHRDSATDIGTNAEGSTLTTTYAAFMSQTQPAGTYIGQVRYTLVHPANEEPPHEIACEVNKICYNANTNIVEGQMRKQSSSGILGNKLYASNYKRDGYGFAGWNDKYDYSGNYYGPNQEIYATSNGLSLYAVWIESRGTLQNWNDCQSLGQGATTALTDERDGNVYAVAKLADGKCWMIENLRLDDGPELSSTNTHNPSLPLINIWYYSQSRTTLTTSNHLSPSTNLTEKMWCADNNSDCDNQSVLATDNTTQFIHNISGSQTSNIYSYGNYYNWYSATAGHGKYGNNYGAGFNSPGDICPVGWHLPTGNTAGEFSALDVAMGGTGELQDDYEANQRWLSYPNNFVFAGYAYHSTFSSRNTNGSYWSASGYNDASVYRLLFSGSRLQPGVDRIIKSYAMTVRCISDI